MKYLRNDFGFVDVVVMLFILLALIAFCEAILWAIGKLIYG